MIAARLRLFRPSQEDGGLYAKQAQAFEFSGGLLIPEGAIEPASALLVPFRSKQTMQASFPASLMIIDETCLTLL